MDKQLRLWASAESAEPSTELKTAGVKSTTAIPATARSCDELLPRLITSREIADATHSPLYKVDWVLKSRSDIKAIAIVGRVRVYPYAAIARVRHELNAIAARSEKSEVTK